MPMINGRRRARRALVAGALVATVAVAGGTVASDASDETPSVHQLEDLIGTAAQATATRGLAEQRVVHARQALQGALDQSAARARSTQSTPGQPPVGLSLVETRRSYERAVEDLAQALGAEHRAAGRLQDTVALNGAWSAAGRSTTTAIPPRVSDMLSWTAARAFVEHPRCRLDWSLLAAISNVEGDHGRYGGSQVLRDGSVYPPIIGVALDGDGVAAISDSDDGRFDGDSTHDRAVGPFQFIPSTWARYGRDGNGDGLSDPQNYRDAALAAADYLCAAGGDLSRPEGVRAAVYAYNHSDEYVATVLELANTYREVLSGA
ncbi:MAG: lytic transglycosylase domain-containing protein [Acidimicrobiales bacterium]